MNTGSSAGTSGSPKRVVEEITVPGLIVSNAGASKDNDIRVRFKLYTIGAGGDGDEDESLQLEQLLNREDIILLDYHKYTYQHTFHVAITYSEPLLKKNEVEKREAAKEALERDLNQAV